MKAHLGKALTRNDLAAQMNSLDAFTVSDARTVLDALLDMYVSLMRQQKRILMGPDLGALTPLMKSARPGRNPKTLEPKLIAPRLTYSLSHNYCGGVKEMYCTITFSSQRAMLFKQCKGLISLNQAKEIIRDFRQTLHTEVKAGNRIELRGFGAFSLREYAKRTMRNPSTGETFEQLPESRIYFRLSGVLRKEFIL